MRNSVRPASESACESASERGSSDSGRWQWQSQWQSQCQRAATVAATAAWPPPGRSHGSIRGVARTTDARRRQREHRAHPPTHEKPRSHQDTKGFTKPPADPKTRRRRGAEPPTRPKTQRRKGAKTQRRECRLWAPFRIVAAERLAIGSPAAGEKRAISEREHSSSPRFPPAAVPGARRFCLSPFPLSVEGTVPSPSS